MDREGTEDAIEGDRHEQEPRKTEGGHIRHERIEAQDHQLDPAKIPQQEGTLNSPSLEDRLPLVAPEQDEDQESRDLQPEGKDLSNVLADNHLIRPRG